MCQSPRTTFPRATFLGLTRRAWSRLVRSLRHNTRLGRAAALIRRVGGMRHQGGAVYAQNAIVTIVQTTLSNNFVAVSAFLLRATAGSHQDQYHARSVANSVSLLCHVCQKYLTL